MQRPISGSCHWIFRILKQCGAQAFVPCHVKGPMELLNFWRHQCMFSCLGIMYGGYFSGWICFRPCRLNICWVPPWSLPEMTYFLQRLVCCHVAAAAAEALVAVAAVEAAVVVAAVAVAVVDLVATCRANRRELKMNCCLVGGLELFFLFHTLGIIIPTDFQMFARGWNHQPVNCCEVTIKNSNLAMNLAGLNHQIINAEL